MISFEYCYYIAKVYKDIIGLRNISHFSLNVVDKDGKMSILSLNPQIAYNIFKDGTYRYNGSISPSFYNQYEIYTWDETYSKKYHNLLINNMERKNGIKKGVVLTQKLNNIKLLFSFATKGDGEAFHKDIVESKSFFLAAGYHCFDKVKNILEESSILDDTTEKRKPQKIFLFPEK
ncbi:putative FlgJ-like protein [Legionella geestiana]|uniref:Putative FlgJ-like protein n=2 Tax=Legionella geestiana TaxID=45065 RepID=A0A0W0UA92_9GAMM|nr:putative FlgJ-like protein [Legionella geestiana]STX52977.1 putative FlgJ-like protein [Legionella geestiana]